MGFFKGLFSIMVSLLDVAAKSIDKQSDEELDNRSDRYTAQEYREMAFKTHQFVEKYKNEED